MSFKDTLKKLRTGKSLSQSELAESLNVSKSAISMYENGRREPDFETLEVIADFFNVDMNVLLDRKNASIPHTIAAHFEGGEFTEEELKKIKEFVDFVKSQR